jgi:hypothetical protein
MSLEGSECRDEVLRGTTPFCTYAPSLLERHERTYNESGPTPHRPMRGKLATQALAA